MKYFSEFPIISYSNNAARNILARVKITKANEYYSYAMENGSKPEYLAYDYYGDSNDVWLIHMVNDTIDPYYDYSLSDYDFKKYIIKKYGSESLARRNIAFYHNNYSSDDTTLDISGYSALTSSLKKYWSPRLDVYGNPFEYYRKKDDTIINTNKIISLDVALANTTTFTINEKVTQSITGATGFVTFSNTSILTLQHIVGSFNSNNVIGDDSSVSASVSTVTTLKEVIPATELSYFSAVSYYDYEENINDQKRNIQLMDSSLLTPTISRFRGALADE